MRSARRALGAAPRSRRLARARASGSDRTNITAPTTNNAIGTAVVPIALVVVGACRRTQSSAAVLACHVALSVSKIFIADSSLHPFLSIGTRARAPSSAAALFSNMSILVCGTGAIGSAVARLVPRASARPILAGRDAAKLAALSAELAGAETRVVDFAAPEAVPEALGALPADLQGVVYAVGNARLQPMRAGSSPPTSRPTSRSTAARRSRSCARARPR